MSLRRYKTSLFSTDTVDDAEPPYQGRGWFVDLDTSRYVGDLDDPGFLKWERALARKRGRHSVTIVSGKEARADAEIFIHAKNRNTAQRALTLISIGLLLVVGSALSDGMRVQPPDDSEGLFDDAIGMRTTSLTTGGLALASLVAARLSRKQNFQSAAWKYYYAYKQCEVNYYQTHPYESQYSPITQEPESYVAFASSIVNAYGAIEDLGLEIRASSKYPSKIDGRWNPKVLTDLQQRLVASGIDPVVDVVWQIRSTASRLHRKRGQLAGVKASWARGRVRDRIIPLTEALSEASFLRSKVSAHKAHRLTQSLSVYDVHNVQNLARILLLMSVNCWGSNSR